MSPTTHGRPFSRLLGGVLLAAIGVAFCSGCAAMPNPAKRLANHVSTKASEAKIREKVENDKFPTAKDAGVE
jgi:hypothetical protein